MQLSRLSLIWKIYAVGLIQIAIIALGFLASLHVERPIDLQKMEAEEDALTHSLAETSGRTEALTPLVHRARRELGIGVEVRTDTGELIVSTLPLHAPPCSARPRPMPMPEESLWRKLTKPPRPSPGAWPRCRVSPIAWADGTYGRVELRRVQPPPPPSLVSWQIVSLVLAVVGICSLFLARSLALPLRGLSSTAQRFGEGDLSVRLRSKRGDELGDLSRTFDDMADRIVELLRAERELIANVSHELRTPLARIRVALTLVEEEGWEAAQEYLAEITEDLDELEQLTEDVLLMARLSARETRHPRGLPPLRDEEFDLVEQLERVAERGRRMHPDRSLRITLPPGPMPFRGDARLLRRALGNLLDNAFKYSEVKEPNESGGALEPGAVELIMRETREGFSIEILDRGIGIDERDLAYVQRPFFRADRSRTKATGGVGLGLALARSVIEAHEGRLVLESQLGEGTMVRILLPLEQISSPSLSR